jgi:spermidine synthase
LLSKSALGFDTSNGTIQERVLLPLLLFLFVGSGIAALIYEVVWFQLLQLVIGSSSVSLGVLLAIFMGGMCLGSLLLSRFVSVQRHPFRVYAWLELGIGFIGVLVLYLIPFVGNIYTAWGGYGIGGFLMRGFVAALCLLPPTLLMGATLPAVARWVKGTPTGISWMGFFYAANIAGAVIGCLLAGFYLLRVYDMAVATYTAVVINVVVAMMAFILSRMTRHVRTEQDQNDLKHSIVSDGLWPRAPGGTSVLLAIGLSGLCALGAQVIWTRTLAMLFGGSVYTFSILLAVFLVGLGMGSGTGSFLSRTVSNPRRAFGWCQLCCAVGIAWTAYMLAAALPYWPVNPSISSNILFNFQVDIARAFLAMFPATFFWGASFPLALAALSEKEQDSGRLVGGVYAANTLGAIVGALSMSLLLVSWVGSQLAQQILILLSAVAGVLVLIRPRASLSVSKPYRAITYELLGVTHVIALVVLLIWSVPATSGLLVAHGRYSGLRVDMGEIIYMGEGTHSSVAVSRLPSGVLNYHNAGKIQASSEPVDMRLQRMLGHLTTLLHANPKSVVVIGCGAGVTAGAVSIDPRVERVTIVEIEPLVPKVVSTYFSEHNFDVIRNPKVEVRVDDARHYLLTTDEKFDAITSDPFDPWVKGAATLYTKEFLETVRQSLNPGGIVTLFVQLYESNVAAVKSEVATFFDVFPNGVIWGNTYRGRGYDMVLLGQVEPLQIDLEEIEFRLADPSYGQVARSLRQIGMASPLELFATYAGRGSDLKEWLSDAVINRDRNLRLQYFAGLGLNFYESDEIYTEILSHREFPADLFVGPEAKLESLRAVIQRGLLMP